MVTMDEALLNLYQNGDITKDMAISYAQDAPALTKRLMALA
jgi:Tfp pilus assembly pilus retraction ATPase PilT